jgi:putative oxidoreductase
MSNPFQLHDALARALNHLRPLLLLGTRWFVSWQFLKSGWIKLTEWENTLALFHDEYRVPLLPADAAAVVATCGELLFPILLVLGLFTRVGALGLFTVNLMAVVSYWHVLGSEGSEAALAQHVLWGYMLTVIALVGGGVISLDAILDRRRSAPTR